MNLKDVFQGIYAQTPVSDRAMEERTLEVLITTFRPDPEEAELLLAAVLGRMLDDEWVNYQFQKLKVALQHYTSRNAPHEVDDCLAWHEKRARIQGD